MKKILILTFITIFCTAGTSAQKFDWNVGDNLPEGWSMTVQKGDELKGTEDYTCYSYESSTGTFVFWNDKPYSFRIVAKQGIFNSVKLFGFDFVNALYGFYDKDGNLISKDNIALDFDIERMNVAYSSDWRKAKKERKQKQSILDFLVNGEGFLRFLVEKYGGGEVEIKMPCLKN